MASHNRTTASEIGRKVVDIPTNAPTIGTATALSFAASIAFTAPDTTIGGPATIYIAKSNPGDVTATGSTSPITVTGLNGDSAYTFTVAAGNSTGYGPYSSASTSITTLSNTPDRALFMGGASFLTAASALQTVDYVAISTTGNATNFGNLITARTYFAGSGSSTRAILGGGTNTSGTIIGTIEYFTIASPSNGTSFGNLTVAKTQVAQGLSNDTYGMFYGGIKTGASTETNEMEYVTIATTGNATSFGTLTRSVFGGSAAAGNTTRGIIAGGPYNGGNNYTEIIQYFTWGTSGNSTSFGNVSLQIANIKACSSSTRMVYGGGFGVNGVQRSQIEYVEIATTGNGTSFGNQTVGRTASGSTSNKTRGIFAGGADSATWDPKNTIEYITIATTGNGTSFGNMTSAREFLEATSGSHGGLA